MHLHKHCPEAWLEYLRDTPVVIKTFTINNFNVLLHPTEKTAFRLDHIQQAHPMFDTEAPPDHPWPNLFAQPQPQPQIPQPQPAQPLDPSFTLFRDLLNPEELEAHLKNLHTIWDSKVTKQCKLCPQNLAITEAASRHKKQIEEPHRSQMCSGCRKQIPANRYYPKSRTPNIYNFDVSQDFIEYLARTATRQGLVQFAHDNSIEWLKTWPYARKKGTIRLGIDNVILFVYENTIKNALTLVKYFSANIKHIVVLRRNKTGHAAAARAPVDHYTVERSGVTNAPPIIKKYQ